MLPGGLVPVTGQPAGRALPPPAGTAPARRAPGTWIVKSMRHVVAASDLDTAETAGPMMLSEPRRARPGSAPLPAARCL